MELIIVFAVIIASVALIEEWYYVFAFAMFAIFVALVLMGIRDEKKIDVSHLPRHIRNGL